MGSEMCIRDRTKLYNKASNILFYIYSLELHSFSDGGYDEPFQNETEVKKIEILTKWVKRETNKLLPKILLCQMDQFVFGIHKYF